MTPSIDTLTTPPVIGRYYMVPTVRYNCCGLISDWPVFGPKHDDAEIINFPWPHYHHDSRFMSKVQYNRVVDYGFNRPSHISLTGIPIQRLKDGHWVTKETEPYESTIEHPKPIYKRMRCKRAMHAFPTPGEGVQIGTFIEKMREHYKSDCLRVTEHGTFCPHRGVRLDTLVPVDGVITCPLHGLRFHAATGKSL